MSRRHLVFVQDKQQAPTQPKPDPAQEGVGEGATKAAEKTDLRQQRS
ncbi:hypothetical protein V1281_006790 [Nitrobacteraceae bacterium AZCC 2161]